MHAMHDGDRLQRSHEARVQLGILRNSMTRQTGDRMKSSSRMSDRFRTMLDEPAGIELPGCYDVLSAMILERAGFPAVFMSGYGIAASFLGNPDIGLTSLVETSLLTKNISGAIHVPLVVDADNGYGDEDNVVRTVFELER